MERKSQNRARPAELGTASKATRGGPVGYIEATGFLPKIGISND